MKSRSKSMIIGTVAIALGLMFAPAASADEGPSNDNDLSAEISSLREQGIPLNFTVDVATGEVIEYEEVSTQEVAPSAVQLGCPAGVHSCWLPDSGSSVILQYGFTGPGVTNGSWALRGIYYQFVGSGLPCWAFGGGTVCSQIWAGPGDGISPNGIVTGVQVTLV